MWLPVCPCPGLTETPVHLGHTVSVPPAPSRWACRVGLRSVWGVWIQGSGVASEVTSQRRLKHGDRDSELTGNRTPSTAGDSQDTSRCLSCCQLLDSGSFILLFIFFGLLPFPKTCS